MRKSLLVVLASLVLAPAATAGRHEMILAPMTVRTWTTLVSFGPRQTVNVGVRVGDHRLTGTRDRGCGAWFYGWGVSTHVRASCIQRAPLVFRVANMSNKTRRVILNWSVG